jgi:hypothetical protein
MTSEAPDHEGRAAAMELVIGALMANFCRDPRHPTLDEMRAVSAEVAAILKAARHDD